MALLWMNETRRSEGLVLSSLEGLVLEVSKLQVLEEKKMEVMVQEVEARKLTM
jgi:hypothetical protein